MVVQNNRTTQSGTSSHINSATVILSAGTTLVAAALLASAAAIVALPCSLPLMLLYDDTARSTIISYVSIVVTPQNVIKAVAADALLSEVYSARTPLKIALGYVISLTSSYLLLLATLFAWITEESKQHIDKFMRSAPVELQCAWLATLQPLILLQWLKRCWWPATKQARLKVVFYTAAATALAGSTILPSGIFLSTAATVWTALT